MQQNVTTTTSGREGSLAQSTKSESPVTIPLSIHSDVEVAQGQQPLTFGVPLPQGTVHDDSSYVLGNADQKIPVQTQALAYWPDGSVQWLLVDCLSPTLTRGTSQWQLVQHTSAHNISEEPAIRVEHRDDHIMVDTGACSFEVDRKVFRPFQTVRSGRQSAYDQPASETSLVTGEDDLHLPMIESTSIETAGPLRTTIRIDGKFAAPCDLRFRARLSFFVGTGLVRVWLMIHNPHRAEHPGGIWDLGDAGSRQFQSLTLALQGPLGKNANLSWQTEVGETFTRASSPSLEIYQDSSGGENWQSKNHVNRDGINPCRFRGYQEQNGSEVREGYRASPVVNLSSDRGSLSVSLPEFWQQFPKAFEVNNNRIMVGLFPHQWDDLFELQGGERKSYVAWLRYDFEKDSAEDSLNWTHRPARIMATPNWIEQSNTMPYFQPAATDANSHLADLMKEALEGENSLRSKAEAIDEYGWRNYGDQWADHEQTYYEGSGLVTSHYNNQFDMVYGAIGQMMRSGDPRWFDVFDPLARHVMDIDIYHTQEDKAAYNGGLFWFTDHYRDAATATHRTFSGANQPPDGSPYGGGPGSEHNFATGLRMYHLLTGDPEARDTVLGLADWVLSMDDGSLNVLGIIDSGPTGLASMSGSMEYHGPGRGAGNSIEVLLDAWALSAEDKYLLKAEQLIRRCIHPLDDIAEHDLLSAEKRWSYTMFLSTLARYLDVKSTQDKIDAMYGYAQQSLVHYACWMNKHERPYLDHPEELEFPTEAWAAQELRKANVLRLASRHVDVQLGKTFCERAHQIAERAWNDFQSFSTRTVTRALAIMMREAAKDIYFHSREVQQAPGFDGSIDLEPPIPFVPQKMRVKQQFRTVSGLGRMALSLVQPAAWNKALHHLTRKTA